MKTYFYFLIGFVTLLSCKDTGPHPVDLVGNYVVSARMNKDIIDKDAIQSEIKAAMQEASSEMAKAKEELAVEMDFNSIDTSTTEGKMEYAAKKFGQSMAEVGMTFGEAGKNLGDLVSNLAVEGVGLGETILNNINLEIELQADGDIKAKSTIVNLGLKNATWEVVGDQFILHKENNDTPDTFIIKHRTNTGFTIENDDISIDFNKKP